jgi:integrase
VSDETRKKLPRGIHRTADGRFRLYVTRGGKPVRIIVTWELLAELKVPVPPTRLAHPGLELAQKALTKLQSKILEEERTGVVEASMKTKVGDLLVLAEQDYANEGRTSWAHAEGRWKNHLKAHFADVPANGVTTDMIDQYIVARQKQKASAGTVNRETALLKRLLHLGMRTKPRKVSSVPYFPHLKEADPRQGFLTQAEYDILKEHAKQLWLRTLLAVWFTFGWRKTEVLRLRARQVDLTRGTISLPPSSTKEKFPRVVAMTGEIKALLAMLMEGKTGEDQVFCRDEGRYKGQPVRDIRNDWTAMFAAAGIEERMVHDMRRSAIMNGTERGVNPDTMMKISGHRTQSVFSRYNIQKLDRLRDAARLIEAGAVLEGATDTKTDTDTQTAGGGTRTH